MVAARTELINATRGLVKSMGTRLPKCSSPSFGQKVKDAIPEQVREALLPLLQLADALSDCIQSYDQKIEEVRAHEAIAPGEGGRSDHRAGLCVDLRESGALRQEPRCGALFGISAEAGRLRREPAAIGNQQSWRHDGAQAVGGECALYLGTVWTRHRPTTLRAAAVRAWGKERKEESRGGGSAEAGGLAASSLGEWRGL